MMFSPGEIEVLLHYYYSPEPHPNHNAPVVSDAIHKFRRDGIFTNTVEPELTLKGQAWLKLILNTPYPTECFIDQHGNIIKL